MLGLAALPLGAACGEATRAYDDFCADPGSPGCAPTAPAHPGELGRHTSAALVGDTLVAATWDRALGAPVVAFYSDPDLARDAGPDLHVLSARLAPPSTSTAAPSRDPNAGRFARLAVQSDRRLQVAWFDADRGAPRWTRGDRLGFDPPELVDGDEPGLRGTHLSLALDAQDRPHLAYRDETRRALRYAVREDHPDGPRWVAEPVDTCASEPDCPRPGREDVGEWAQIALVTGAGGVPLPRIAFYDRLRGDLKLAARDEAGRWTTSTLDGRDPSTGADTGDVGRFLSLAQTPMRTLGLAYYDASRGVLRYLGPGETPRVVDPGLAPPTTELPRRLDVGQYASLRYDAQGRAHILYVDASTPALRYVAVRPSGSSAPRQLDLPAGAWLSLASAATLEAAADAAAPPDPTTRLVGAYGAFDDDPSRTRLRAFALTLTEPPP